MSDSDDLTARMFAAAKTIDAVRAECAAREELDRPSAAREQWSAYDLRTLADRWDREAAEQDAEDAAVDALAREIQLARIVSGIGTLDFDRLVFCDQQRRLTEARQLIKSGYRKAGQ